MAEKEQKNKSGIGKFFLGAALGAAAGAAAAKFINIKTSHGEKELEDSLADATDSLVEDEEEVLSVKAVKPAKSSKPEKKERKKKEEESESSES